VARSQQRKASGSQSACVGHVDIHDEKPEGWAKEMMAGTAFVVLIAAVLVILLAM